MTIATYFAYACIYMTYFWRKQESQADLTYPELIGLWILIQEFRVEFGGLFHSWNTPFDEVLYSRDLIWKSTFSSFLSNNTDWIMQWKVF